MGEQGGGNGFHFSSNGGSFTFTMHSGGGGGGSPFGGGGGGGGGGPAGMFSQFFGGGGGPEESTEEIEHQPENPWGHGEYFQGGEQGEEDVVETVTSEDGFPLKGKTRFCAVLYVKGVIDDENPLAMRNAVLSVAKSYRSAGVRFFAADCEKVPAACRSIDSDVQQFPMMVFFPAVAENSGDEERPRFFLSGADTVANEKALNTFLNDAWPGTDITFLKSLSEKENCLLRTNEKAAKVVFVTDKKASTAPPPLLRALAEDLANKVVFAIAGPKVDDVTFRSFSVPKDQKLPCFYDAQAMKFFTKPGEQLRHYIIAIYKAFQKTSKSVAKISELTSKEVIMAAEQKCGRKDYRYCLLALLGGRGRGEEQSPTLDPAVEQPLLQVAREFKQESSDPLRVHWVRAEDDGPLGSLAKEIMAADGGSGAGAPGDGQGDHHTVVALWRPKRGKFEVYGGGDLDSEKLLSFVRGYIDGGKALKQRHGDIWPPAEKLEL